MCHQCLRPASGNVTNGRQHMTHIQIREAGFLFDVERERLVQFDPALSGGVKGNWANGTIRESVAKAFNSTQSLV